MIGSAARTSNSWGFEEGEEIAPGRTVLRVLGGGSRYEVHLVWDERLFALTVAELLRPDQVDDERARASCAKRPRPSSGWPTRCSYAASPPCSRGRGPTC